MSVDVSATSGTAVRGRKKCCFIVSHPTLQLGRTNTLVSFFVVFYIRLDSI